MSSLPALDTILLIALIGFAAWGFINGLIKAVGGIIGIIIGAALASRYYLQFAQFIGFIFGPYTNLAAIVSFAFIFLLVGRLFGIIVHLFEQAFDVLAFVPFLKSINRLAGSIFGFLLGVLILGTLLFVTGKYSEWTALNDAVNKSQLAQAILNGTTVVTPFLPENFLELRSYF